MNTKIIITIGPNSEDPDKLNALLKGGADLVRVNFSHASHEQYVRVKKTVEVFNRTSDRQVLLIQDLQGPRIRIGDLAGQSLSLKEGEIRRFSYGDKNYQFSGEIIPIDSPELYEDIKKGDPLYLSNGEIELQVIEVEANIIVAKVFKGGLLTSHKGVNIPSTNLKKGGLTTKDIEDVKFALKVGVDFIALSFVQTAKEVEKLRRLIGNKPVKIIAKIERAIALKNIDSIITASDAIMIARGDLGIEIPFEDLPIVQKNLVRHAHWYNKPAIIATQIMTSMINNDHPTRAEVSDIANAVLDGGDIVMLSDETAIGNYANEAVKILKKVIIRIEKYINKGNVQVY